VTANLETRAVAQTTTGQPRPFAVETPDGVSIAAQEWGNPDGPEILFITGFSQSHLSWLKQVNSGLAETFRMITYDPRGHGESAKPTAPEYYAQAERWAAEVDAVMRAAHLRRPVVVGWSNGGYILWVYLSVYGDAALSGVNFVDAVTSPRAEFYGPGVASVAAMRGDDLAANIAATRAFVRACTAQPLPSDEFELWLAFNMVVPSYVRRAMAGSAYPPEAALSGLRVPVLVTHGLGDTGILPAIARYVVDIVPGARASLYEGVGHSPFWEDPDRFNRELSEFVLSAWSRR
jgi:non-heme chloroperoxidase